MANSLGFVLALLAWACAAPDAPPSPHELRAPAPVHKKRVLVYTVSAGYVHDVAKRASPDEPSIVEQALVHLGRATGRFDAVLTRDAEDFTPENLAHFDLVFFYTTGELPFSESQKQALFDFVAQGKAFAGAHCASDTFYSVPEYGAMLGAYFDEHPWAEPVHIVVEDAEHPACAHLGQAFEMDDEIYQFKAPYDRSKLHVLLHLDATKVDLAREKVHRADRDFALAWTKDYGRGRVFYTALGHRPEVWRDPRFLAHLDGGLCWAMHLAPDHVAPANSAELLRDGELDRGLELDDIGTPASASDWKNKNWGVLLRATWTRR